MTAEVVIMNKTAVAMAADSAATFDCDPEGTEEKLKIHTSVNKLFALSKYHGWDFQNRQSPLDK